MPKHFDVSSVCNALVDIIVEATDQDLKHFSLTKGVMHLVDQHRQVELLSYLNSHEKTVELGGSAMNAIRTLAQLGKRTMFGGMVSDDEFGERIRSRMSELGIEQHLGTIDGGTGTCVILVTPDGERTMNTSLGASRLYGPSNIPFDAIAQSRIFHFCGYQWDTDGQKEGIQAAIATAKANDTLVSFDVADPFVVQNHHQDILDMIKHSADIVFSNEAESKLLYGTSPLETAAAIAKTGAIAVIKLGAKGAIIQKGNEVVTVDPVATTVLDTTAAGDMFAAGFLYGYVSGRPLGECGKIGATLASDVISRYGARLSPQVLEQVRIQR